MIILQGENGAGVCGLSGPLGTTCLAHFWAKHFPLTGWTKCYGVCCSTLISSGNLFGLFFSFLPIVKETISTWSWSSWGKNQGKVKVKDHRRQAGNIQLSEGWSRLKTRKTIPSSTYDNKHTPEMNHSESRLPVSGQGSGCLVQGQPQPLLTSPS